MENEEFNLDDELKEVREKREKEEAQRKEELYDYLGKLKLKRMIKEGIAIGLAGAIMVAGVIALRHKEKANTTVDPYSITEEENTITLTRYYTVTFGDTLSGIADETGIPMSKIQDDNEISNPNMIDMNQRLVLNYKIEEENLENCTQVVFVNGQTVSEIASEYETNIQTLITLNPNSIINMGEGAMSITTDTLVVPDFNAIQEYNNGRSNQR